MESCQDSTPSHCLNPLFSWGVPGNPRGNSETTRTAGGMGGGGGLDIYLWGITVFQYVSVHRLHVNLPSSCCPEMARDVFSLQLTVHGLKPPGVSTPVCPKFDFKMFHGAGQLPTQVVSCDPPKMVLVK